MFKSLFKNSVLGILNLVIGLIVTIYTSPLIINGLGFDTYGLWVVINSILGIFSLSDLGIGQAVAKLVSDSRKNKNDEYEAIISTAIAIIMSIATFLIIINIFITSYSNIFLKSNDGQVKYVYLLMSINFSISFVYSFLSNIFIGFEKIKITFYLGILNKVIYLCTILVISNSINITNLAYSQIVTNLLLLISVIVILRSVLPKKKINLLNAQKKYVRKIFAPSIYLFIIKCATILVFNSDNLVLKYFFNDNAVGLYSTTYKITSLLMSFAFIIPDVTYQYMLSTKKIEKLHLYIYKITILIATFFMLTNIIFGSTILHVWIGEEYVFDEKIILIFSLMLFFSTIEHTQSLQLISKFKHKGSAFVAIAEGIVNLILSIVLLKVFGIMGVALGTLVANMITSLWYQGIKSFELLNVKLKYLCTNIFIPTIIIISMFMLLKKLFINNINSLGSLVLNFSIFSVLYLMCFMICFGKEIMSYYKSISIR